MVGDLFREIVGLDDLPFLVRSRAVDCYGVVAPRRVFSGQDHFLDFCDGVLYVIEPALYIAAVSLSFGCVERCRFYAIR